MIRRRRMDMNEQYPPERKRALRARTRELVHTGEITLLGLCERCGSTKGLAVHHKDYDDPYNVSQLCRGCHAAEHYVSLTKETAYTSREIQDYILHTIAWFPGMGRASYKQLSAKVSKHCVGTQFDVELSQLVTLGVVSQDGDVYRAEHVSINEWEEAQHEW